MNVAKLFVFMAVALVALTGFASAQNLDVKYVRINGEIFDESDVGVHDNNLKVEKGEEIELKVRVKALANVSNVQVEADIYGYKYSHKEEEYVSDTSRTFDLDAGDVDTEELNLMIPLKMDKKYTLLRVRVGDEDGLSYEKIYQLHVVGTDEENAVIIKDFSMSPSSVINAGRAFTAMVRVENIGEYDIDDVKVTVSVPELNIRDVEYLDELEADEKESLEEFLLRVPDCAEPGTYNVEVEVEFDEYYTTLESEELTVLEGNSCTIDGKETEKEDKETTVIRVPESKDVNAGSEIMYPILIANEASTAKAFTITVSGVNAWGTSSVSPSSLVVVAGGTTETVYLSIKPNQEASGEKVFLVNIASDNDKEVVPITANVVASEEPVEEANEGVDLKKGLEVALVVLVIILIIVGLIIGFNKLRGQEDEGAQTYY